MKASLFFRQYKNQLFLYHEEELIHGDTDRCEAATVRFGNQGHRHLSWQGNHQGNLLQLEAQIRGMDTQQLKELKSLQEENRRLKQMYADLSLDHRILKDIIEKKL